MRLISLSDSEVPGGSCFEEIPIGGYYDSGVHRNRLIRADALDLLGLQDAQQFAGEVALHLGIERSGRRVERRACAGRGRKRAGNTRTPDLAAGNPMARSYWRSGVELLRAEIIEVAKRVPHTVPPTCKAHGRRWRTPSVFPGGDPD